MNKHTHDLPQRQIRLTPELWPEQLNTLACDSAQDALLSMPREKVVELAFATLQAYFTLIFGNSCPFLEQTNPEASAVRLSTVQDILTSCDLAFDTSILATRID